mmetsp:Transcript_103338/g.188450  ORF Transcript_103338/g.188450 Transcript_103338/m.188450 type:complete len:159 (+) Transcript_103338:71-547(+)
MLETVPFQDVAVDLPIPNISTEEQGQGGRCDGFVQIDLRIDNGHLKILGASESCKLLFAPVDPGSNIEHRIGGAGELLKWLESIKEELTSNQLQVPYFTRFGKVQMSGCMSSVCYRAYLDVLFPEAWSPRNEVISCRFVPTCMKMARRARRNQHTRNI